MGFLSDALRDFGGALGTVGPAISSGIQEREAVAQQNRDLQANAERAAGFLSQGNVNKRFNSLEELFSGLFQQITASSDLAGLGAANTARAGLNRAGLGSTGLGQSLAGGLQAGASFQGNALRARLRQDLLRQAGGLQQAQGSLFAGTIRPPTQAPGTNIGTDAFRGVGVGLEALGTATTGGFFG